MEGHVDNIEKLDFKTRSACPSCSTIMTFAIDMETFLYMKLVEIDTNSI